MYRCCFIVVDLIESVVQTKCIAINFVGGKLENLTFSHWLCPIIKMLWLLYDDVCFIQKWRNLIWRCKLIKFMCIKLKREKMTVETELIDFHEAQKIHGIFKINIQKFQLTFGCYHNSKQLQSHNRKGG